METNDFIDVFSKIYDIICEVDIERENLKFIYDKNNTFEKNKIVSYEEIYNIYYKLFLEYNSKNNLEKFSISYIKKFYYSNKNTYNVILRWYDKKELKWNKYTFVNSFNNRVFILKSDEPINIENKIFRRIVDSNFDYLMYIDIENSEYFIYDKNKIFSICSDSSYYENVINYNLRNVVDDEREEVKKAFEFNNIVKNIDKFGYYKFYCRVNENGVIRDKKFKFILYENHSNKIIMSRMDITETREHERIQKKALQEAYKYAQNANNAKSDFLSRMSHDIRTPLNGIIGMTAIAEASIYDPLKLKDALKKITMSGKHLLGLINNILDMSKIESGNIDINEEEFSIDEFIMDISAIIRPLVKDKNHSINFTTINLEHNDVIGDTGRIGQVIINILSNAIKYTPENGKIDIIIEELPYKTGNYGCFSIKVKDNGIGMTKEFQKCIFEPFSREKDSRIDKIQGTGLGMAIVKNLVMTMGGDITVKSELGKGSEFNVVFYWKLQDSESIDLNLIEFPVLIVDDDEDDCMLTSHSLSEIGMTCDCAYSGKEAIEKLKEKYNNNESYYAIIVDWKMPEMNGLETSKKIRELLGINIPIIVLTSYDWSDIEDEAKEVGVDSLLSKPANTSKMKFLFKRISESNEENVNLNKDILKNKCILLAEDNELNQEIMFEQLSAEGTKVVTANNGKEAFELFLSYSEGYFDCILMDVQMPVMNGYEATIKIRNSNRIDSKTIPIIAVTANVFAEDVRNVVEVGMNAHISKPIEINKLYETLSKLM